MSCSTCTSRTVEKSGSSEFRGTGTCSAEKEETKMACHDKAGRNRMPDSCALTHGDEEGMS